MCFFVNFTSAVISLLCFSFISLQIKKIFLPVMYHVLNYSLFPI